MPSTPFPSAVEDLIDDGPAPVNGEMVKPYWSFPDAVEDLTVIALPASCIPYALPVATVDLICIESPETKTPADEPKTDEDSSLAKLPLITMPPPFPAAVMPDTRISSAPLLPRMPWSKSEMTPFLIVIESKPSSKTPLGYWPLLRVLRRVCCFRSIVIPDAPTTIPSVPAGHV